MSAMTTSSGIPTPRLTPAITNSFEFQIGAVEPSGARRRAWSSVSQSGRSNIHQEDGGDCESGAFIEVQPSSMVQLKAEP